MTSTTFFNDLYRRSAGKKWLENMSSYPWTGGKFKWDVDVEKAIEWCRIGTDDLWHHVNNCFKVPYQRLMELIFIFGKELRQPYKDVLAMPWYEVEMMWQIYQDYMDERKKHEEEERKRYEEDYASARSSMPTANSMSQMMSNHASGFSTPSIPTPSLNNFKF